MTAPAFRSAFERRIAAWLDEREIAYGYERYKVRYLHPVRNGRCASCKSRDVSRVRTYLVDFSFPGRVFVIECKGRFTSADRTKMLSVKRALAAARTGTEVRFVFQRDNKLTPGSSTKYGDWARKHGFKFSIGTPDPRWFTTKTKRR